VFVCVFVCALSLDNVFVDFRVENDNVVIVVVVIMRSEGRAKCIHLRRRRQLCSHIPTRLRFRFSIVIYIFVL